MYVRVCVRVCVCVCVCVCMCVCVCVCEFLYVFKEAGSDKSRRGSKKFRIFFENNSRRRCLFRFFRTEE